jgi:hypothetical protein
VGRGLRAGAVVLVVVLAGASVPAAASEMPPPSRADESQDPFTSFGLHLVDDLTLKWRSAIPTFAPFEGDDTPAWSPWGEADADASIPRQAGHFKLGLGVGRLGLHIDSHTIVEGSAARVRLRLGLDLGAGRLTLQIPDVKVTPRFDKGQVGFDWFLPLVEQRF